MFGQKTALTVLILYFFVFVSFAQKQALSKIDTDDLRRHLTFIASDELQGRKMGTEVDGLGITADYLAENAKKIGVKPAAENYFQKVEMVSSKPVDDSFIEVKNKKGKSKYQSKSIISLTGNAGVQSIYDEKVVLAGFGTGEIDNLNLEDKIVVIAQGNPESFKKGDSFRWNNRIERGKIESLSGKKPKAIIIVTNPQDKENRTFAQIKRWFSRQRYQLKTNEQEKEVPTLIVLPAFADELLGKNGKYEKYLTTVDENSANTILVDKKFVSLKTGSVTEAIDAKNVVGIVEGSDPELKDEYMVFMAHYDHLGIGENGDVYNGADDNGSGTVTLLEVAEAFMSLEQKPKRSIVFLWVTAEEVGLLGSQYYSNNPVFPLEKTVACINIDMDGRVYEPRDSVWSRSPKKVKDFDGLFTLANEVWPGLKEINTSACETLGLIPDYSLPPNFLRASDHYYFHNNGVPILNYSTGYHADYHKVGDEVSRINFDKMKRVADLCFLVGYEIANQDKIEFERPEKE